MPTNKNFSCDPTTDFISASKPQDDAPLMSVDAGQIEIHADTRERKSKRIQLLVRPSLYKKLRAASAKNKLSMNEFINQILEGFLMQ